ncbi:MAG: putative metal-dependent hydrolase [Leeuwenhoekiella sp.]
MESNIDFEKLRYPIGKFLRPEKYNQKQIEKWIFELESFPLQIKLLVNDLSTEKLNWKYRPGGWTINQIIHHCADSHMNSFMRFKLSLTEDKPVIKPYFEDRWAELPDSLDSDPAQSIKILEGLHARWGLLLKSLNPADLSKEFIHPEHNKTVTLSENIGIYAWHCNHHLAHIKQAILNEGKFES